MADNLSKSLRNISTASCAELQTNFRTYTAKVPELQTELDAATIQLQAAQTIFNQCYAKMLENRNKLYVIAGQINSIHGCSLPTS